MAKLCNNAGCYGAPFVKALSTGYGVEWLGRVGGEFEHQVDEIDISLAAEQLLELDIFGERLGHSFDFRSGRKMEQSQPGDSHAGHAFVARTRRAMGADRYNAGKRPATTPVPPGE